MAMANTLTKTFRLPLPIQQVEPPVSVTGRTMNISPDSTIRRDEIDPVVLNGGIPHPEIITNAYLDDLMKFREGEDGAEQAGKAPTKVQHHQGHNSSTFGKTDLSPGTRYGLDHSEASPFPRLPNPS